MQGTKNLDIFSISAEQVSPPDKQAGCLVCLLGMRNPMVPPQMCVYCRYFESNDKLHFSCAFDHVLSRIQKT